jgi:hypothetical protein
MHGHRSLRRAVVALTIGLGAAAFLASAGPSVASAANPHRAAVIVDTGTTVHRVVITFSEDSISGIDALQRAGANPLVYAMGPGAAVCRIYGVGRDPGSDCLGGQDGDNRYWAYFRAPAGASGFTFSSIGAGSARVHDGDVEGWKWGTGTAPAFVSLSALAPPQPPPTQTPATAPATQPRVAGPPGDSGSAPASPSGSASPAAGASTTMPTRPATGSAPARSGSGAANSAKNGRHAAAVDHPTDEHGNAVDPKLASADGSGGGGGSVWSLALFAVLIVAIVAAILLIRRVRKQHT